MLRVANTVLLVVAVTLQSAILVRQYDRSPPKPDPIRNIDDHSILNIIKMPTVGSERARLAIVEFSDYECPFCRRHASQVLDGLKSKFVEPGLARYVFANFPLAGHEHAKPLARAALCAGQQQKYWSVHDGIFMSRPRTSEEILNLMVSHGIEPEPFTSCFKENRSIDAQIDAEIAEARRLGLNSTPSFAIGLLEQEGSHVLVRRLVVGAQPVATFEAALSGLM